MGSGISSWPEEMGCCRSIKTFVVGTKLYPELQRIFGGNVFKVVENVYLVDLLLK